MLGVYVAGKTGGHLNPAVTFCNCLFRGHPWRKFPIFMAGQILGAMAGAFVVYGNYRYAIDEFEGGSGVRTMLTAGVFCTYPADFLDTTSMFWSEVISSAILMFVIFAMTDKDNIGAGQLLPLCLFFLIFGIGACWGWLTGYAINLARDFGPRLVSYIVGYGTQVWSAGNYYFWVRFLVFAAVDVCRRWFAVDDSSLSLSEDVDANGCRRSDPHGRSLHWLHPRRLPVRPLPLRG
jgi:aquaglyceroporin related protein